MRFPSLDDRPQLRKAGSGRDGLGFTHHSRSFGHLRIDDLDVEIDGDAHENHKWDEVKKHSHGGWPLGAGSVAGSGAGTAEGCGGPAIAAFAANSFASCAAIDAATDCCAAEAFLRAASISSTAPSSVAARCP